MMTIFWIGCALAALASLAAWIADCRSTPADKAERTPGETPGVTGSPASAQ
jgi:hypothetical protein